MCFRTTILALGLLSGLLAAKPAFAQVSQVPLELENGTFVVPVLINDTIKLNFMVDSGAADVTIPADVVSTLSRAGTITKDDILGERDYKLADGSKITSLTFRIRSMKIGNVIIENVTGSVGNKDASLLLGQSFLSRLHSWSFDNRRKLLIFELDSATDTAVSKNISTPNVESELVVACLDGHLMNFSEGPPYCLSHGGMRGTRSIPHANEDLAICRDGTTQLYNVGPPFCSQRGGVMTFKMQTK
jgi:clan AA aspartic protease (TIGR02281 family)